MKGIANYGARHDRMNITNKDFMNMPINFPPLQEQKKIAQILSTWDRAIEKQEKLIEAKEKLKKGLMQRLLMGEVRFKEFGSGTLVLQNGGVKTPLPSGWKEVRLGEVLKEINEKSKIENEYNILSSTIDNIEIRKGRANSKTNIGYKILKINQLVLSPQNLWLGNININTKFKTGLVSPSYKIFDIKNNKLLVYYAKYLFKTGKMLFQYKLCSEMGASIVRRNLNLNLFFLIKLKLPPLTEQQKIAQVLSTADREIELLKKELEELKKQKKGLMQRLLSGEVRVKV
jgi:type I restriction enzyme S subunit